MPSPNLTLPAGTQVVTKYGIRRAEQAALAVVNLYENIIYRYAVVWDAYRLGNEVSDTDARGIYLAPAKWNDFDKIILSWRI